MLLRADGGRGKRVRTAGRGKREARDEADVGEGERVGFLFVKGKKGQICI